MSGTTPSVPAAKAVPMRPKAVCASSKISVRPRARQHLGVDSAVVLQLENTNCEFDCVVRFDHRVEAGIYVESHFKQPHKTLWDWRVEDDMQILEFEVHEPVVNGVPAAIVASRLAGTQGDLRCLLGPKLDQNRCVAIRDVHQAGRDGN